MNNVIEGDVWLGVLRSIKSKLSQESFNTWFQPLAFEGLDEPRRVIRLRAPSPLIKNWVNTNYSSLVEESLAEVSLDGYLIGWTTEENGDLSNKAELKAMTKAAENNGSPNGTSSSSEVSSSSGTFASLGQKRALQPPALNPKYTYESFVVGSCNQFAHAASSAVAEAPGKTYNPYTSMAAWVWARRTSCMPADTRSSNVTTICNSATFRLRNS